MPKSGAKRLCAAILLALPGCALSQLALAQSSQNTVGPQDNGQPAVAEAKPKPKVEQLQGVAVTASLITSRPDLALPTPVVPVSASELNLTVQSNIGTALADLPQFVPSITNASTSSNADLTGLTSLNLRGLGTSRTLTLLNGRRFSGSNDMNSIPGIMIKGVQIVTGGASATWGSDAVAGVANIILDDKFVGFDSNFQGGISTHGDGEQNRVALKFGTEYGGGKGHFVIGGDFAHELGIGTNHDSREGVKTAAVLPIGGGKYQIFPFVGATNQAIGGVITTGVLAGNVFNPDGTLRQRDPGTFTSGKSSVGGDSYSWLYPSPILTALKHWAVVAGNTYAISDDLSVFAQARFSKAYGWEPILSDFSAGDIPISIDNAFLLPALRHKMEAAGQTHFMMGRANTDINSLSQSNSRNNAEYTVGATGRVGDSFWHWDGSFTHGTNYWHHALDGVQLIKEFAQAVDSVIDPATQQPICRVALVDPSTNCVPLNLFGHGAPSAAAANYVTATAEESRSNTLDDASFAVNGSPFDLPAGPVSIALGAGWRRESSNSVPGPYDVAHAFSLINYVALQGAYTVKEGFGEVFVPLLQGLPFAHDLSTDVAARISDYTGSGAIWSYKAGLNDDVGGGVRLRVDWSRDIRAANADERFLNHDMLYANVIDPASGESTQIQEITGGNEYLLPEKANTGTAGVSWTPSFLSGFQASADYYHIDISNAITSLGPQDILNRCAAGTVSLCDLVVRDASGQIDHINTSYLNVAQYKTDGVDLDFEYKRPSTLFGQVGQINSRFLATWVHKLSVFDGKNTVKYVGSNNGGGGPRWRANLRIGFDSKEFSVFGRMRFLSPQLSNRTRNIVNNQISSYLYFDVGTELNIAGDGNVRLSFNVRNLTNRKPSIVSGASSYYDVIGRYYMTGLEVRY